MLKTLDRDLQGLGLCILIIAFCLERIAEFKVPRYIEYVDEFQRTASGKIQKHALIGAKEDLTVGCWDRMAAK